MSDNSLNNKKKELEQVVNAVKKAKSGNFLGAAKEALKSGALKKKLKRKLIMLALQILPVILVAIILFSVFVTVRDAMAKLLSSISTSVSGLWQWMTDDYWIDLGEKIEYTNEKEETENYTLVDKYIKELGNLGVSLKDLKLLGEADYSDEDALLADEDNKALVEKYISEFVRADLITQEFHKRRGNELVSPTNQNLIDGGVYLFRSKKEATITEDQFNNGNYKEENIEVKDKDYKQMEYVDIEEFNQMIANNDKDVRYKFSLDRETGELLVAKVTTTQVVEADVSNTVSNWFAGLYEWLNEVTGMSSTYEVEEVRIPYKEYIAKYTMPYEFLINLCEITQNPEFVYHVAMLARDTRIVLAIQDDTSIDRETVETEEDRLYYRNSSSSSTSGATTSDPIPKTKKTRKVTTVTTQTPTLKVEYADTWSFYEEFDYTKNIEGTLTEEATTEQPAIPATLSGYQPPIQQSPYNPMMGPAVGIPITLPEYWYDTFVTERRTKTQLITTTTTYNEPILVNSVEKSKQFLGLLRNDTGECLYDCFEKSAWQIVNPTALYCSKNAEFNKGGINVQYKIPNIDRTESPLNKLTSGLQMLYETMQAKSKADKSSQNYDPDKDYESMYNQKMQGLVEHIQYLMTFPEEDKYTVKDLALFEDEDLEEEIIEVKDEELEILYKVCEAEAGGSSEEEIGHVASVILNRVKSSKWPNTIKGVVFQKNQFSCIKNGAYDRAVPSEKTKRAVDSIVANGDSTGGAYYYRTEASARKEGMPTSHGEVHPTYVYLFKDPNTHIFYTDKDILNGAITDYPIKKDSYIVAIDAGHGIKEGADNGYYTHGTSGTYNGVTYTEWEHTRMVADRVASILNANSKISVIRIGNSSANPAMPNGKRISTAKQNNADVYVSIHFNGSNSSSARGTEALYTTNDSISQGLASIVSQTVSSSLGIKNRGTKARNDLSIIKNYKNTGFPSIVIEGAFMSNQEDMKVLAAEDGFNKYAKGIADGILQYLEL